MQTESRASQQQAKNTVLNSTLRHPANQLGAQTQRGVLPIKVKVAKLGGIQGQFVLHAVNQATKGMGQLGLAERRPAVRKKTSSELCTSLPHD